MRSNWTILLVTTRGQHPTTKSPTFIRTARPEILGPHTLGTVCPDLRADHRGKATPTQLLGAPGAVLGREKPQVQA